LVFFHFPHNNICFTKKTRSRHTRTRIFKEQKKTTMGLLAKLGRRMFPSRRGLKEKLTMTTTTDCTESAGGPSASTNNNAKGEYTEERHRDYVNEPLSPHHGTVITTPAQKSIGSPHFFSDDFEHRLYDDDEATMGPMILLHASNCSSSASTSGDEGDAANHMSQSHTVNHTVKNWRSADSIHSVNETSGADEDTVLEPSFEVVSLMHSKTSEIPLNKEASRTDGASDDENPRNYASTSSEVLDDLLLLAACCPLKPQRRFDHYGRPFVHIYTECLSTVDEALRPSPIVTGPPKANADAVPALLLEDTQIQARWALAREQLDAQQEEEPQSASEI
jgi:hypothetical protein